MAKTKISEFNANPALNTDIDSINISEGCAPSGINDAIRELMAQLKDWQSGTSNDPYVVGSSGSLTLNQGTANGVLYLNGSKVVTSGSALTFDGTNLSTTAATHITSGSGTGSSNGLHFWFDTSTNTSKISSYNAGVDDRDLEIYGKVTKFYAASSEGMRLTSTGLGIGTSSPSQKLHVVGTGQFNALQIGANNTDINQSTSNPIVFKVLGTEYMRLDSSGNLGLGVTPSAWGSAFKVLQSSGGSSFASQSDRVIVGQNWYNNGSSDIYVSTAAASIYRQTAGTHAWFNAASGTAGNAISFTQAMTLTSGGNLFVGSTTAPTGFARLSLVGGESSGTGSNSGVQFTYNSSTYGGGAITTVNAAGGGMSFYTFTGNVGSEAYTERARIDSSGLFHVGETAHTDGSMFYSASNSTLNAWRGSTSASDGLYGVYSNIGGTKTVRGYFRCDGGLANYSANNVNLSDERLKKDIALAGNYLAKICAIPVKNFRYKDQSASEDITLGVIAQDVLAVAPELVSQDGFGLDEDGKQNYLSVYQTDLQYALMKALQELKAEFDAYKASHP